MYLPCSCLRLATCCPGFRVRRTDDGREAMTRDERAGSMAVIIWLGSATIQDKIAVAAADVTRGTTLDWFRYFSLQAPDSDDAEYS
jgi:hypothetical protein